MIAVASIVHRGAASLVTLLAFAAVCVNGGVWAAGEDEYTIGSRDILKIVVWGH